MTGFEGAQQSVRMNFIGAATGRLEDHCVEGSAQFCSHIMLRGEALQRCKVEPFFVVDTCQQPDGILAKSAFAVKK